MKLKIWLTLVVALLCGGVMWIPASIVDGMTTVEVADIQVVEYRDVIRCTGVIEDRNKESLYSQTYTVIDEVYVEVGDVVKEGDLIARVDTAKSVSAISIRSPQTSIPSGIAGLPGGLSEVEMETLLGLYQSVFGANATIPKEEEVTYEDARAITSSSGWEAPDEFIRAGINGMVTKLQMEKGELIDPFSMMAVISPTHERYVSMYVPEASMARLAVGQKVYVSGTALHDEVYEGIVTKTYPTAVTQTSALKTDTVVQVVLRMEEFDSSFLPGLNVTAEVVMSEGEFVSIVPYEAVRQDDATRQEYVWIVENNTVKKCMIKTGRELAKGYEILQGPAPGQQVVMTPELIKREGELAFVRYSGAEGPGM